MTVDSRFLEYSISRTLLYLEQFIQFLGHLTLDQSKNSRYLESQYLKFSNKFSDLLSNLELFSKFPKLFSIFLFNSSFINTRQHNCCNCAAKNK